MRKVLSRAKNIPPLPQINRVWNKATEKFPVLNYFQGYWKVMAIYMVSITATVIGIVVYAGATGMIPVSMMFGAIALAPALVVAALVTSPLLAMQMFAEVAILTIAINLVAKVVDILTASDADVVGVFRERFAVEEDNVIDQETGEVIDANDPQDSLRVMESN